MNVKLLLNQHVRDHLNFQRGLLLVVFFLLSAFGAQAQNAYTAAGLPVPTVSSDKDDYAPGEVAIITGTGWTLDQQVDVHFEETPAYHEEHQHDFHGITVDGNGNWTIRYQIEQRHFGVAFDVHVIGKQTNYEGHTYFTDGGVQFKASDLPDPTSVTVTAISYTQKNNKKAVTDETQTFIAPDGAQTLASPAEDKTIVYFKYPKSITRSDGLIYTIGNNDIKAFSTPTKSTTTTPVTVSYDTKDQIWYLTTVSDPITVTAAYKLSISPTALSVSSATGTYGGTTTLSATLKSGTSNVSGKTINFSLNDGSAISATTDANGVATLSNVSLGTITAGTYATGVTASFAGDASYSASNGSNSLTISKAGTTTVVTITGAPFTYTGVAITPATVSVTGPGLNETPAATYANNTNAGTATASYSYAETANYLASSDSKTFTIGKADATIAVEGKTVTYDGNAHGATGTATGVKGEDLSSLLDLGASFTNVPGGDAAWSFAGNTNYKAANGSVKININKLGLVGSFKTANKVYDGNTSATVTGYSVATKVGSDDVNISGGTATFATAAAGNGKTVTLSGAALTGAAAGNYSLTSVNTATADITARSITITADAKSKYCGIATDPALTYQVTAGSVVGTDAFTGSLSRAAGETVGAYAISSTLANSNYDITYVGANLTINGISVNSSDANSPRSNTEEVVITILVSDGTAAVAGVPVKLVIDNSVTPLSAVSDANGKATFSLGKLSVAVYKIEVTAGTSCYNAVEYLPVYDPTAGFVTGGGWINSPAGAYADDMNLVGKANFGFVSRYRKGSTTIVDGNTEFHFQAGKFNFKSSSHTEKTLVVSGHKATYKGEGNVDGSSLEYKFMVSVVDGHLTGGGGSDKYRIKITEKVSGKVVYDNLMNKDENYDLNIEATLSSTVIGGGSIVIHQPTKSTSTKGLVAAGAVAPETLETTKFQSYPNPYNDRTTITFSSVKAESFALEVYDVKGALVRKVGMGVTEAGKTYSYEFESRTMPEGMYFARLITNSGVQTIKMVLKK